MADSRDPFRLAARQIELDGEAMRRLPGLSGWKQLKLAGSAHGLFRGSAPLFYEILAARPELAEGPPGEGWIVGDMHVENVGAYRTDSDTVAFDLNDFDDATTGPLRLDVLRLSTSMLLAARALPATGVEAIALVEMLLEAYARQLAAGGRASAPPLPSDLVAMIDAAKSRTKRDLLDARAPMKRGRRSLERGPRYLDLPADVAAAVPRLLRAYVTALGPTAPGRAGKWTVSDAAQRVAGTGSLGRVRIALLVADDSGEERLVEIKQAVASAVGAVHVPKPAWAHEGERVVMAARALTAEPPQKLAAIVDEGLGLSFMARKLAPQEDKLDLAGARVGKQLDGFARVVGHLLGSAHARGLRDRAGASWSAADRSALVERAVELAGLFEAIYLAYAKLARAA